jgi:hypothetical protein
VHVLYIHELQIYHAIICKLIRQTLCLGVKINTGTWPSRLGEPKKQRRQNTLTSPAGRGPERRCAGEAQQQLKTTDPTSRQRGRPHRQIRDFLKIVKERRRKTGRGSQMGASH